MSSEPSSLTCDALRDLACSTPGLDLLVLHGSRARGDARAGSDWDFGYLASARLDPTDLLTGIVRTLHEDRIDLADLASVGGLLRYRAARDGVVLFESSPGLGDQFRFDAVRFWCDAQALLQTGYQAVLDRL